MSKPKKVANTLTSILDNKVMKVILDKSKDIETVFKDVDEWWRYDLYSRKPGPAYIDGEFVGTDLDLACFAYELASRNAVINIPTYKSMRAKSVKTDQVIVSSENRHGKILDLVANKDVFSFSLRIEDMNVIGSSKVGAFRNFSITDLDGEWYPEFGKFEFIPNAKENKFIYEHKLNVGNDIQFTHFVHPNRWAGMFGQYYFMTKALIDRLKDEASYYFNNMKTMLANGIEFPNKDAVKEFGGGSSKDKENTKKIKVDSFQVELDLPENDTKYPEFESNQENLVKLNEKRNYYLFKVIPKFMFAVRTVEYAYYKYGNNRIPNWLENVKWEEYKEKRTMWDRVILFQPKVGEIGVSIKKRVYKITQEVSKDYEYKGKNKNYIAFVLDESGSMFKIREEIISLFNEQVDIIKSNSDNMENCVSLVTFSDVVNTPRFWNASDSVLKHITHEDYIPNGWTALNDAIASTVKEMKKAPDIEDPSTSFLLVIISDGDENRSKEYKGKGNPEITRMLEEVQNTGKWTVTYLGSNQDLNKISQELHIPKGNITSFKNDSKGTKEAGFVVSAGLHTYYSSRSSGLRSVDNFYDNKNNDKDQK